MEEEKIPKLAQKSIAKHKEYALISQVAHMYYNLNMLQPEIAKKMFFSRSKVSRMLTQARELGIVEIKVRHIVDRAPTLEKKLHEVFGLKEALVITCFDSEFSPETFSSLTDYAAIQISSRLKGKVTLGISNGRTVNTVVEKLRKRNPCTLEVVQLMGSISSTYLAEEARNLVEQVIEVFNGKGYYLNTPLYVDDTYAKNVLLNDSSIAAVFEKMQECDLVVTGIGSLSSSGETAPKWYGYQTARHLSELREKGAVGSVCAQYYDINGNTVACEWNEKCLAMPLEEVRRNPMTVGIASGDEKVDAILGALRGGIVDLLMTDAITASKVLEANERLLTQNRS